MLTLHLQASLALNRSYGGYGRVDFRKRLSHGRRHILRRLGHNAHLVVRLLIDGLLTLSLSILRVTTLLQQRLLHIVLGLLYIRSSYL